MPIETTNEFTQRHGGLFIRIGENDLLFPDGAAANTFSGFQGQEPPADPRERLGKERQYWAECLRRIEVQFHRVKTAVRDGSFLLNWDDRLPIGPRPHSLDAVGLLEHLKALAVEPRSKFQETEAALAAIPANAAETERQCRLRKALRKRQLEAQTQQRAALSITL